MKMLWSDLEVGDVVKVSDEAKSVMIEKGWSWLRDAANQKKLIITNIHKKLNSDLSLTFQNGIKIFIDNNGKFLDITLFEVIELKEE